MGKAKMVLDIHLNKLGTKFNTLTDLSFDELPFLVTKEPVLNMKGEKVSKSYFDLKGREVVKIVYNKIIEAYTYNGVDYPNTFIGLAKEIHFIDWSGATGYKKEKQPYYFTLEPVFNADNTETIVGFSSPKQRKVLKEERYSADDYLQSKNPPLYALIYSSYGSEYEKYLRTGISTLLVDAMNNEADPTMLANLNHIVYGTEITIKELIIMNLQ